MDVRGLLHIEFKPYNAAVQNVNLFEVAANSNQLSAASYSVVEVQLGHIFKIKIQNKKTD
jgi:hypothetical protein